MIESHRYFSFTLHCFDLVSLSISDEEAMTEVIVKIEGLRMTSFQDIAAMQLQPHRARF